MLYIYSVFPGLGQIIFVNTWSDSLMAVFLILGMTFEYSCIIGNLCNCK